MIGNTSDGQASTGRRSTRCRRRTPSDSRSTTVCSESASRRRSASRNASLVLPTSAGNVLWETTSLVTADAVAELETRGGISNIVISHPHFYASMVEWSEAFGGVPIVLHANDREWIARPSEHIELWDGDVHQLTDGVTLYRCPGHFPGSTVLHADAGPTGRPILLAGDALHVAQDRRHVSFMYSVPNHVPSHPDDVAEISRRLDGVDFDDLYGFTWGLNIIGDARAVRRRVVRAVLPRCGGSDPRARLDPAWMIAVDDHRVLAARSPSNSSTTPSKSRRSDELPFVREGSTQPTRRS